MIGEIIDGEIHTQPRPSRKHNQAASVLNGELHEPYRYGRGGPGGWIILFEAEVSFGENILVPDLAGWKAERLPDEQDHNWIDVIPDWVCEVISPSTAKIDRTKKMSLYGVYEVPYVWLIDPNTKTLEAFKLQEGKWMLLGSYADEEEVSIEPFSELKLKLSRLWGGIK